MKDIRLLTLKKVCLPQTKHLEQLLSESNCNFVSFQDYHFISVSPVTGMNGVEPSWAEIYESIAGQRSTECSSDERICQTLLLYGNQTSFWSVPPELLFVSMVHLANRDKISHEDIENRIRSALSNSAIPASNWCIYYSLDYCDFIIFTKDVDVKILRSALWRVASNGDDRIIKEISTQLAVSKETVFAAFKRFKDANDFVSDATHHENSFTLIIEANLQTYIRLNELKSQIEKYAAQGIVGSPQLFKIFGYRDICITVPDSTIDFLLYIAYVINETAISNDPSNSIGVFTLRPYILDDSELEQSKEIETNDKLFSITNNYLHPFVVINSEKNLLPESSCEREICQSLSSLVRTTFSEEFALCIMEPFAGYLGILLEAKNDQTPIEDVCHLQRSFIMAISLLSQAIMHNDGEFVHAPSFQTRLFDVPPKLVALYGVAAHEIVKLLRDSSEIAQKQNFYFLFNPDQREDIHVEMISPAKNTKTSNISIVYMSEGMFYNPEEAISILCHEIAHQAGSIDRHRDERWTYICICIAYYLCKNIFFNMSNDSGETDWDLLEVYCKVSAAIGSAFAQTHSNDTDYLYLSKIRVFLDGKSLFLNDLLDKFDLNSAFSKRIIESLEKEILKLDERAKEKLLDKCNEWLETDYLRTHFTETAHQLSQFLLLRLNRTISSWSHDKSILTEYAGYVHAIIEAFSETYSDLRMIELLDISDVAIYRSKRQAIFTDTTLHSQLPSMLRDYGVEFYINGGLNDELLQSSVVDYKIAETIGTYLKKCERKDLRKSTTIRQLCGILSDDCAGKAFDQARSVLMKYRDEMDTIVCEAIADKSTPH